VKQGVLQFSLNRLAIQHELQPNSGQIAAQFSTNYNALRISKLDKREEYTKRILANYSGKILAD
jgi:hypothetical protein